MERARGESRGPYRCLLSRGASCRQPRRPSNGGGPFEGAVLVEQGMTRPRLSRDATDVRAY